MRLPWLARLLVRVAPVDRRPDVEGDLAEVHVERRSRKGRVVAWAQTVADAAVVAGAFLWLRRPAWGGWVSAGEVRLAARLVRREPLIALVVSLAIAVGIGTSAAGFTLLLSVQGRDLGFRGGEDWVVVSAVRSPGGEPAVPTHEQYAALGGIEALAYVGAFTTGRLNVVGTDGYTEQVAVAALTPGVFAHLPHVPLAGRTLRADDASPDAERVVLLGEAVWRRRFAGDASVVGRTVEVAGVARTVVGVMPASFGLPVAQELWLPLDGADRGGDALGPDPGARTFAILANGADRETVAARVTSLWNALDAERSGTLQVAVQRYATAFASPDTATLLGGLVALLVLVLVVTASNVAILILVRTTSREGELALRTALGAARSRLVGQVFIEVLLLAGAGAALGVWGSGTALAWLDRLVVGLPFWMDLGLDVRVVAFAAGLAILTAGIAGALPALRATRRNLAPMLHAGGRSGTLRLGRLSVSMIALETALALAFLSVGTVLVRALLAYSPGASAADDATVLTAEVYIPPPAGATGDAWVDSAFALQHVVIERLRTSPHFSQVGIGSALPRVEAGVVTVQVDGLPDVRVASAGVDAGFFPAIGVTPTVGRIHHRDEVEADARVVIVNQPFVNDVLGGGNPLGRRLRVLHPGDDPAAVPWREIIGVVPDLGMSPADPARAAGVYLPLGRSNAFRVVLRNPARDPNVALRDLRTLVAEISQDIVVQDAVTLDRTGWEARALLTGIGTGVSLMGGLASLLSLLGLYAILSFTVHRRTREIGIRMALGARSGAVLGTILDRALRPVLLGIVAGVPLAIALMRGTSVLPIRVDAGGPGVLAFVLATLCVAGALACWVPARRVLRVDPVEALRAE